MGAQSTSVGTRDGSLLGAFVGVNVGLQSKLVVGFGVYHCHHQVGFALGARVGTVVGISLSEGFVVTGFNVGYAVGSRVGLQEVGNFDGRKVGALVVGLSVGVLVTGFEVGYVVGTRDGSLVGIFVGEEVTVGFFVGVIVGADPLHAPSGWNATRSTVVAALTSTRIPV